MQHNCPGYMAVPKRLNLSQLSTSVRSPDLEGTCTADVLAVNRYISDTSFSDTTRQTPPAEDFPYTYDILLTDGEYKRKCLLSVTLNPLVRKNILCSGSTVVVRKLLPIATPTLSLIMICDVTVVKQNGIPLQDPPFWPGASEREKRDVPLVSSRGSYLSTWNSVDPFGQQWNQQTLLQLDRKEAAKFLSDRWKLERLTSGRLGRKCESMICGRVVSKSRLVHFGKPRDSRRPFPFMFNVVIQDETSRLPVVIWDELCVKLFKGIHVGDVLALKRFKVKPRYQRAIPSIQSQLPQLLQTREHEPKSSSSTNTQASLAPPSSKSSTVSGLVEISLLDNSVVRLISPTLFNSLELNIPPVSYKFVPLSDVRHIPDNILLDMVGLVTFVGRWERSRQDVNVTKTCADLWSWRWVAVKDESSAKSVLLQLFACSNPLAWNALEPGKVLVCTRCRVCSIVASSRGKPARMVFLTTTSDSQVGISSETAVIGCTSPLLDIRDTIECWGCRKRSILSLVSLCRCDEVECVR